MPGDEGLLEEFIADLPKDQHPEIIGPLVRTVFEKMKLAGEAGSLLKIEEELKEAVEQARICLVEKHRNLSSSLSYQVTPNRNN